MLPKSDSLKNMKIGLWNIDHPETQSGSIKKEQRFNDIRNLLIQAGCDAYILTEANAAIDLPEYNSEFSEVSPFISTGRYCGEPNVYHQVAIYSKTPLMKLDVAEPINGLLCQVSDLGSIQRLYGNVITIKDQWSKTSSKTYKDRLEEQIEAIQDLPKNGTLVGGDFNLRLGWPQKLISHSRIKEHLATNGWVWPTELRDDTVQHVLHSDDITVDLQIDFSIKYQSGGGVGLSDHPFIMLEESLCLKK
jgi:hypothetical protein